MSPQWIDPCTFINFCQIWRELADCNHHCSQTSTKNHDINLDGFSWFFVEIIYQMWRSFVKVDGRHFAFWPFSPKKDVQRISMKAVMHIHPWQSIISSKFVDRLVYEKCCVLTTLNFINFHVNQSLATNGNEWFVWVTGNTYHVEKGDEK